MEEEEKKNLNLGVQKIVQLEIMGIFGEEITPTPEWILGGIIGLNGQDNGVLLCTGILVDKEAESGMIADDDFCVQLDCGELPCWGIFQVYRVGF